MNQRLNAKFHALLTELGAMDSKEDIVWQYTGERTTSSKEMAQNEICSAISALQKQVDEQRQPWIRKIAGVLYTIANKHKPEWLNEKDKLIYSKALKRGGFEKYKLCEMKTLHASCRAILRNYENPKT